MFQLEWDDVRDAGLNEVWEDDASSFPVLQALVDEGVCTFSEPVRAEIHARRLVDMLEVDGWIATSVRLGCSRCLADFSRQLHAVFRLTFTRELPVIADVGEETDEEGVELTPDELGLIHVEGEQIDLRSLLAEQIVLELPAKPLCRHDCAGLCPHCGRDLNAGRCSCEAPVFNNRFAALKDLKIPSADEDD
ncbi:uncharacterized protein EDC39_101409 [Geothermobacter ehrlichii]|uniref:DUF177 domain-containing protein n=1 Tax=Geothermobacter ehrlichii TaxID=213224 RepID=A0A5D3WNW8_9BACT|nr:DUF177 domain-containing protein [Geothermobacter ehrlichii]TYP00248.1 uncharacterized protein EDC39_101409 [Geothermobacter ehrlichii]